MLLPDRECSDQRHRDADHRHLRLGAARAQRGKPGQRAPQVRDVKRVRILGGLPKQLRQR